MILGKGSAKRTMNGYLQCTIHEQLSSSPPSCFKRSPNLFP